MAVLGKRKASKVSKASEPSISAEEANEIFRRHFEAQFAPLEDSHKPDEASRKRKNDDENDVDDSSESSGEDDNNDIDEVEGEEDEWGGLSDNDDEDDDEEEGKEPFFSRCTFRESQHLTHNFFFLDAPQIQIVDHSTAQTPTEPKMSKKELKAFMSSKITDQSAPSKPSSSSTTDQQASPSSLTTLPEDAPSLLKQDLELRRLIAESHLLAPSHGSTSPFASSVVHGGATEPKAFTAGRTRQRATDMRLQALGSKGSILKQEKMPMNMRKGMVAAAEGREAKRRREAKENGVILEKSGGSGGGNGKAAKKKQRPRERGVDGPAVGRMKGAELRISDRDVRKIEGGRDAFGRRSKR